MTTSWALLIDAENIQVTCVEPLLKLVRLRGDIDIARVYGNVLQQPGWVRAATEHGLVLRHQAQITSFKNGADIALAVDAVKLMHAEFPTAFCIVSADSDFVPLAVALRAVGRRVVGAGVQRPNEALRNAYHDWLDLGPGLEQAARCAPPAVELPVAKPSSGPAAKSCAVARDDQFVEDVIEAMNGDEWTHLGKLGHKLTKNGRPKTGGRLRDRLKTNGFRERRITGGYEIARPL